MAEEKKGFFRRLAEGLTKTRNNIVSGMDAIFTMKLRKSLLWAISESTQRLRLLRI